MSTLPIPADLVMPDDPSHPRLDPNADPDLPFVTAAAHGDGPCPDGDACPDARRYGAVHPKPD